MTSEEIKEYLSIVLDMETNILIQQHTIERLQAECNRLGRKRKIEIPNKETAFCDTGGYMLKAGIAVGAITTFIVAVTLMNNDNSNGIFESASYIFSSMVKLFITCIISGILGGLVIGGIISACIKSNKQEKLDSDYNYRFAEYEKEKAEDERRVKNELLQKSYISCQIDSLHKQYRSTCANLDKLYSYNIIDKIYHYDIVAVSSFYQYFRTQRTYSLFFDRNTADKGAYNIFEEEKRLNLIISKLDIAIAKLNEISKNQIELYNAINNANRKIDSLSSNVKNMSRNITSAINEQSAIEAYNAEREISELRFMNTMNIIYKWH